MSASPASLTLVTGATGFLGAALVRQLAAAGERVRILRRATSRLDLLGDAAGHVEHAEGDVTEGGTVREAVRGVGRVYHAAAYVGFGGKKDEAALFEVNADGTAHVVDAALAEGVTRLVHVSSIAALGRTEAPTGVLDETASWTAGRANTAYARSKRAAELEVQRGVAEGLDAVIGNPAVIFGLGRAGENTMQIVERVRRGRMRAAPAGGTCVVDVEDVAAGLRAAMARGAAGERYLLGGENLSWLAILTALAEAFGVAPPRRVVGRRAALALGAASEAFALLTRTRPVLTRETARTSAATYRYSNRTAVEELGATFRPFRETAARIAERVRSEEG